jgi:curli biogenesis system outer membrane secretion channel CsgG
MRSRIFIAVTALLTAALFSGCATGTTATVRGGGGPTMAQARAEAYNGPKARVAVVKFIDKSAKGAGNIGSGMADMLVTALFQSNRYIMLDRQDINDIINEQDFAEAGRVSDKTAAAIGAMEGADLLVMGAVTEFEPEHIGAGGVIIGLITFGASLAIASKNDDTPLGAVTYKQSSIAIDLKIVDAKTGRIVYTGTVKGRYENWGGGVIGGVGGGWSRTPIGLGGFSGTGAEQAIRKGIEAAVTDIVKNTPAQYYRVQESESVILASQLAAIYPVNLYYPNANDQPKREARVISDKESYSRLLSDLSVVEETAPQFDWSKTRLLAVFAGEKPVKGYRIAIEKAIHLDDVLEVRIAEAAPPASAAPDPSTKKSGEESGPDWPFDVVRISNTEKPIRFVWQ